MAMLTPMTESLRDRRKRRTAEAVVAAALELFAERGFERTTIEQIAAAADISRRTFFRYFADKEELFFAEDERLLEVVEATLDAAPAGEPVLELARRATRALAAHSVADPQRRLARERLIAVAPALQARRLAKNLRWEQAIAARLRERARASRRPCSSPSWPWPASRRPTSAGSVIPAGTCPAWSTRASPPSAASPVSGALAAAATLGRYGKGPALAASSAPRRSRAAQDGCP
jgi:AcrR family transcriptional regulator